MASGYCHTASGSCGGKRKWRRGSGSGDGREHPGDPPTHVLRAGATEDAAFLGVPEGASIVGATEDAASFAGVRVRVTAEIKRWIVTVTRKSHDFFVDITTKKLLGNVEMRSKAVTDVAIRKAVAATIHVVARLSIRISHTVRGRSKMKFCLSSRRMTPRKKRSSVCET